MRGREIGRFARQSKPSLGNPYIKAINASKDRLQGLTVPTELKKEVANITQRYRARFRIDSVIKGQRCRESPSKPRLVDVKLQKNNEDIQRLCILPKQRNYVSLTNSPVGRRFRRP